MQQLILVHQQWHILGGNSAACGDQPGNAGDDKGGKHHDRRYKPVIFYYAVPALIPENQLAVENIVQHRGADASHGI